MSESHFDVVLGATTLGHCRDVGFSPNVTEIPVAFSDGLDVARFFSGRQDPQATLTTEDLDALLGSGTPAAAFLSTGYYVASSGLLIPFATRADGGTYASGLVHSAITAAKALVLPQSLGWQDGADALVTMQLMVMPVSADGVAASASLTTGTAAPADEKAAACFGPGPVLLDGTNLAGLTGVSCSPGIESVAEFFGKNHPTARRIVSRRPRVELTFESVAAKAATAAKLSAAPLTSLDVYFLRRSGASFVADATAEHGKIMFTNGLTVSQGVQSRTGGNAACTLTILGQTMTGNTTSALPA